MATSRIPNQLGRTMIAIVFLGAMHAPLAGGEEATPKFKITAKRDNDKVDVLVEPGEAIFSVHSPFGISEANVERLGPNWPVRVGDGKGRKRGRSSFLDDSVAVR